MLFDSTDALRSKLSKLRLRDPNDRIDATTSLFHDYHDPEINRLFASSPPAPDEMVSYNFDRDKMKKDQYKESMRGDISSHSKEEEEINVPEVPVDPDMSAPFEYLIRVVNVSKRDVKTDGATMVPSLLSLQLRGEYKQTMDASKIASVSSNRTGITVYSPDRKPIEVYIDGGDTVSAVIRKALDAHEACSMEPPLQYRFPQCYDLRLHEGDGEPDEDFPALDRKRQLKQFGKMNEFCLCRNSEPIPKENAAVLSATTTVTSSSSSASLSKSNKNTSSYSTCVPRRGSTVVASTKFVGILMPQSNSIKLAIEDSTTAKDLLFMLAKTPRMRMFRDEFVFHVLPADKARLQFTQSMLPPDTLIAPLGVMNLELRKRYFADDPDSTAPARTEEVGADGAFLRTDKKPGPQSRDTILYTDITAAVYQEWTVLKKNKFGRIQERIMGIDSSKIYNYETQKRNTASVRHAQRNLSSVLRIEYVSNSDRAFKILYAEDGREPFEIEYQCTTPRNCAEIVSKINYLLAGREKGATDSSRVRKIA